MVIYVICRNFVSILRAVGALGIKPRQNTALCRSELARDGGGSIDRKLNVIADLRLSFG